MENFLCVVRIRVQYMGIFFKEGDFSKVILMSLIEVRNVFLMINFDTCLGPIGTCLNHFRHRWVARIDFSLPYL